MTITPITIGALCHQQAADPNFSSVVTLMHFEGSNGSTTYTNSCPRGPATYTPAVNNHSAAISTAHALYGGSSYNNANSGGSSYLQGSSSDLIMGAGDFTIEFAYYITSNVDTYGFDLNEASGGKGLRFDPSSGATGRPYIEVNNAALLGPNASFTNTLNAWNRVAVTRSGSTMYFFKEGQLVASSSAAAASTNFGNGVVTIGGSVSGNFFMTGFYDEVRISKGLCRYTANYTLATAAFPDK